MKITLSSLILLIGMNLYAQNEQKYSSLNPMLFSYTLDDIHVQPPQKYNNGKNIIKPNIQLYPWENKLENGMPNVVKDTNGNIAIYISSFIAYSENPPSKVGVMAYTNNTDNMLQWVRPEAGLFWYNPNGKTADEKISPTQQTGFLPTNIVAVDVESFGIYDDLEKGVEKPIKFVYLPQRESKNTYLGGYEITRDVTEKGIYKGFGEFKEKRKSDQFLYKFKFINGDTHMNYIKFDGEYYFCSRLNGKRSSLKTGEQLPFHPDPRNRFRRETITKIGPQLVSKDVDLSIGLDMSTPQWEPYSLQPFQMPGFEKDIFWGLVTMYGTAVDPTVQHLQRTELAISTNGMDWMYIAPGVPFLDNGKEVQSDDHGCINIGKPICNTKFSRPNEWHYFYAASQERHVTGRNPGISVAIGKAGKLAGLKGNGNIGIYYSANPKDNPDVSEKALPLYSIYNALRLNSSPYPLILADVTEDPRDKKITDLKSYAYVLMFSYDPTRPHCEGHLLGGTMGSSIPGTTEVSDNYESVGTFSNTNIHDKNLLLNFLKENSIEQHKIISAYDLSSIPIILESGVKAGVLYGIKFEDDKKGNFPFNIEEGTFYNNKNWWGYTPIDPQHSHETFDFSQTLTEPNKFYPLKATTGSIAVKLVPSVPSGRDQVIFRIYGDDNNDITLYYTAQGDFLYRVMTHGEEYASMKIQAPKDGFQNKEVIVTVEAVKKNFRKYGSEFEEDATVLHVSCPNLKFEKADQQKILWNWRHPEGQITETDKANARGFAYLNFTSFIGNCQKITFSANAESEANTEPFTGKLIKAELATKLPSGKDDFYNPNN
ncbi:hypothetical protein [Bacteroides gallinarum]|uniref:hypothetical protein n=1 Tax=Bacteroides gallinarum TaxID=376806 RepID=UPI0003A4A150|nr:hypothetical protein [Bacteroides gallinarum]